MSHRENCPTRWQAEREGERAFDDGRSTSANPYHSSWPEERCEDADRAWRDGYRSAERHTEERAEERAAQQRAEERHREAVEMERAHWEEMQRQDMEAAYLEQMEREQQEAMPTAPAPEPPA